MAEFVSKSQEALKGRLFVVLVHSQDEEANGKAGDVMETTMAEQTIRRRSGSQGDPERALGLDG